MGACQTVGADHVVFGSDTPPMMALGTRPVDMMEQAALNDLDKGKVYGENAIELLAINRAGVGG